MNYPNHLCDARKSLEDALPDTCKLSFRILHIDIKKSLNLLGFTLRHNEDTLRAKWVVRA